MRRYAETLFRHKELFLAPVIIVPTIALLIAFYTGRTYKVEATVWVDPSQYLTDTTRIATTPSQVEAQALQEWFETESFRLEVMNNAGLTEAIARGDWPVPSELGTSLAGIPVISGLAGMVGVAMPVPQAKAQDAALEMMEQTIAVSATGNNLLAVTYTGKEPFLGQRLLEEALALYNNRSTQAQIDETASSVAFYSEQAEIQRGRMDAAAEAVATFLRNFPDPVAGQVRPAAEVAELDRLRGALSLERELYQWVLTRLEEVRITAEAQVASRTSSFLLIDTPTVPSSASLPASTLAMVLMLGLTLGGIIGLVPIGILTWTDHTVRTREDVTDMVNVPVLAEVPLVRNGRRSQMGWVRSSTGWLLSGLGRRPMPRAGRSSAR